MFAYLKRTLVLVCCLLMLLTLSAQGSSHAQTAERCFDEVPYCISGRIREFWEQNGNLPVFGLPITPQRQEIIEGVPLQVQWFERNRLELHPENEPPYDVLLGRLGAEYVNRTGTPSPDVPREECAYFEQTGFNVCGKMWIAWRAGGLELDGEPGKTTAENLALFGLPLTGEYPATLADGQVYNVQWFERARLERHPENDPPYDVLLGRLGVEALEAGTVAEMPPPPPEQPPAEQPAPEQPPAEQPQPAPAPAPASPGRIAFASARDTADGSTELYAINPDGSGIVRLTTGGGDDPAWSPDGSRIAFTAVDRQTFQPDIYVMNADGSGIVRLTTSGGDDPAWSPDGSRIAFASSRDRVDALTTDIYVMNADGSGITRLTTSGASGPAWSPDGSRIAFSAGDTTRADIYVMNADGSGITFVVDTTQVDIEPAWSPDGSIIAFSGISAEDSPTPGDISSGNVYLVRSDGSGLFTLRQGGIAPTWSPDGSQIAFQNVLENFDIHIINVDGTGIRNLTNTGFVTSRSPDWSR